MSDMVAVQTFCCDRCGNLDNIHHTPPSGTGQMLCYRCQFGHWHNMSTEEQYDSSFHNAFNDPNSRSSVFVSQRTGSILGGPAFERD